MFGDGVLHTLCIPVITERRLKERKPTIQKTSQCFILSSEPNLINYHYFFLQIIWNLKTIQSVAHCKKGKGQVVYLCFSFFLVK